MNDQSMFNAVTHLNNKARKRRIKMFKEFNVKLERKITMESEKMKEHLKRKVLIKIKQMKEEKMKNKIKDLCE